MKLTVTAPKKNIGKENITQSSGVQAKKQTNDVTLNAANDMNFSNSTMDNTERLKNTRKLTNQWETIDWVLVENYVNRLQTRIAKATVTGNKNKAKRLQYLLTHSFYAKAYAVKKVTSNKGKGTSGIDKKLWSTSAAKMKAVLALTDKHYRAKPLRRVFIKKKGKNKLRPLGIPTMYDRAMQNIIRIST